MKRVSELMLIIVVQSVTVTVTIAVAWHHGVTRQAVSGHARGAFDYDRDQPAAVLNGVSRDYRRYAASNGWRDRRPPRRTPTVDRFVQQPSAVDGFVPPSLVAASSSSSWTPIVGPAASKPDSGYNGYGHDGYRQTNAEDVVGKNDERARTTIRPEGSAKNATNDRAEEKEKERVWFRNAGDEPTSDYNVPEENGTFTNRSSLANVVQQNVDDDGSYNRDYYSYRFAAVTGSDGRVAVEDSRDRDDSSSAGDASVASERTAEADVRRGGAAVIGPRGKPHADDDVASVAPRNRLATATEETARRRRRRPSSTVAADSTTAVPETSDAAAALARQRRRGVRPSSTRRQPAADDGKRDNHNDRGKHLVRFTSGDTPTAAIAEKPAANEDEDDATVVKGAGEQLRGSGGYGFGYAVLDEYAGTNFGQWERREPGRSGTVTGQYRVRLPDGRTQTVVYSANSDTGYKASVTYEGVQNYPPPSKPFAAQRYDSAAAETSE